MPLRSFDQLREIFQASAPGKRLRSFPDVHYAAKATLSFGNLAVWPRRPPVAMLAQVPDPLTYSEQVFTSAKSLVSYASFGNAIGTWNARGTAAVQRGEGWILADVDLTQEQADEGYDGPGDYVSYIVLLCTLSDGWAVAILRPEQRDLAAQLLGLEAWPSEGWQPEAVWYGE